MGKRGFVLVLIILLVLPLAVGKDWVRPSFWSYDGNSLVSSYDVTINGNLIVNGDYINATVVNYNVTGKLNLNGNLNMTGNNITNVGYLFTQNISSEKNPFYFSSNNAGSSHVLRIWRDNALTNGYADIYLSGSNSYFSLNGIGTLQMIGSGASRVAYFGSNAPAGSYLGSNKHPVGLGQAPSTDYALGVHAQEADRVALAIVGNISQSANLIQWQNNSGTIFGSIDKEGNLNLSGNNITNVDSITGDGTYVRIGNAGVADIVNSEDELFVSGRLEVNGLSYLDNGFYVRGNSQFTDNVNLWFGTGASLDGVIRYNTVQTPDAMAMGFGADSNSLIITDSADLGVDMGHTKQPDPTIFMHGNDTTDTSEWLSFAYLNGTDEGIIKTGKGNLTLAPEGNVSITTNLDVTNNFTGNQIYGEMHFHNDSTGNVTVLTEDLWGNVTAFGQGYNGQFLNGFSFGNEFVLTAQVAGLYDIGYHISFSGTANNKYHAAVGVNGEIQFNTESHDRISNAADILHTSGTGYIRLTVGDEVTLMQMNEDSSGDATVLSTNVNLERIGT
jgi:hypothetical protein